MHRKFNGPQGYRTMNIKIIRIGTKDSNQFLFQPLDINGKVLATGCYIVTKGDKDTTNGQSDAIQQFENAEAEAAEIAQEERVELFKAKAKKVVSLPATIVKGLFHLTGKAVGTIVKSTTEGYKKAEPFTYTHKGD